MSTSLVQLQRPLEGLAQPHALSTARLIFLISLVVFFTVLFVVSYVWMRRPSFGQHAGHDQPGVPKGVVTPEGMADAGGDAANGPLRVHSPPAPGDPS